jgi:hypothetical protein
VVLFDLSQKNNGCLSERRMTHVAEMWDEASGAHPISDATTFVASSLSNPPALAIRNSIPSVVLHPHIGNPSNGHFYAVADIICRVGHGRVEVNR